MPAAHAHALSVDADFAADRGKAGLYEYAAEVAEYRDGAAVPGGGHVLVGDRTIDSERRIVVTRLDARGRLVESFGDGGHQVIDTMAPSPLIPRGTGVTLDSQGRIIVVGYLPTDAEGDNLLLARLAADGTVLAQQSRDIDGSDDRAFAVTTDDSDRIYVAGRTGPVDGETDAMLAAYGADLAERWVTTYDAGVAGTSTDERFVDVALRDSGDALLAAGWTATSGAPAAYDYVLTEIGSADGSPSATSTGEDLADDSKAFAVTEWAGRPVIAGATGPADSIDNQGDDSDVLVRAFTDALVPDGTQRFAVGGAARALYTDAAGGLVAAGSVGADNDEALLVARLTDSGAKDEDFAPGGVTTQVYRDGAGKQRARAINAGNGDDRVVLVGAFDADATAGSSRDQAAALGLRSDRLTSDTDSGGDDSDGGSGDDSDSGSDGGSGNDSSSGGGGGALNGLSALIALLLLAGRLRRGSAAG